MAGFRLDGEWLDGPQVSLLHACARKARGRSQIEVVAVFSLVELAEPVRGGGVL